MTRVAELPDDLALLKRIVVEQHAGDGAEQRAQRQAAIGSRKAAVDAILRRFYGPRSERFDPRQLLLFGHQIDSAPLDEPSIEEEAGEQLVTRRVKNRHKHGRQQLPEHLERIEIEHDLPTTSLARAAAASAAGSARRSASSSNTSRPASRS